MSEMFAHLLQSSPRGLFHVHSGPQHVIERGQEVMTDVKGKLLNGLYLSDRILWFQWKRTGLLSYWRTEPEENLLLRSRQQTSAKVLNELVPFLISPLWAWPERGRCSLWCRSGLCPSCLHVNSPCVTWVWSAHQPSARWCHGGSLVYGWPALWQHSCRSRFAQTPRSVYTVYAAHSEITVEIAFFMTHWNIRVT